uniref:Exocyst complex component 3-like 2a n=1 Tax=Electrophorus electricus TaxID=8005 RepID=A0A4W4H576_ELEEL
MPILKKLPRRSRSNHDNGDLNLQGNHSNNELILPPCSLNPFEDPEPELGPTEEGRGQYPAVRSSRDDEVLENEVNAELHGVSKIIDHRSKGNSPLRGTLGRLCSSSPVKTLGKLSKGLRFPGRHMWGSMSSTWSASSPAASAKEKKKKNKNKRGTSEEIMTLLRLAGRKVKSDRRESLPVGDLHGEEDEDDSAHRRPSFLRSLSKLTGDSLSNSLEAEKENPEESQVPTQGTALRCVLLEILQLVNQRDLLLADAHIQELERECALDPTPSALDASLRKAKDVELLYEALQREMWDVVRESLRQPCAGPQLGLVVLVIQQEEHADHIWALRQEGVRSNKRPRKLRQKWAEAVGEAADWSLPQPGGVAAGQLAVFLERLRVRVVEDMDAVRRNVAAVYPTEFAVFQVYMQSYHSAVARRLRDITTGPVHITDIYSLLDWVYNIYNRDVLATVGVMGSIDCAALLPLLPAEVINSLEQECLDTITDKVNTDLSQVLEDEEKKWTQALHIEEYQSGLARSVIQRLKVDLDRSTGVSQPLGARVSRCTLSAFAHFLHSFQRKAEMFHETQAEFRDWPDGYVSRTIALANCVPPFRSFVECCRRCDPLGSEDSSQCAHSSLERIVSQCVRVLTDRLFENIRPFFDKLLRRKWLNNSEAYDNIETTIKLHFKTFRRMDCPPYQTLVNEVHRRVIVEYVRAIMSGRVICTSLKMRKRLAFRLQDEANQLKALFKDLESTCTWLDDVIGHLADIILLEDTPSVQIEVAVLVKGFPDIRTKHLSAVLNVRGMVQQSGRQEILAVLRDFENSNNPVHVPRDHALFSEVAVATDMPCLRLVLIRFALTVSSWVSSARPRRKHKNQRAGASQREDEG